MVETTRMAYDSYSSNNQENQTSRKTNVTGNNLRQRSASNLRTPLSNVSSGRKPTIDSARSGNTRSSETSHTEFRGKNGAHNTNRKAGDVDLGQTDQYDDIPENMYRPDNEDVAGWIHREKLAKIENEELQAAGINLAKARAKSKDPSSGRARDRSRDHRDLGSGSREEKRQKTPLPFNESSEEVIPQTEWDPRTPEEIENDEAASQMYTSPSLRKSGSKIPVMTSSPTPIPSERYERETPMPRKRTLSGSITPEDTLSAIRGRTGHDNDPNAAGSNTNSPTKQRTRSTGNAQGPATSSDGKTTHGQRKASAQLPPNSYNNRPATRGNDTDRPRSATNPPEGDPPWLAMMYKPDPRLPPDQQLIPTLAKKQAQEMWEANGKIPATYDRNFQPLQIYGADGMTQQASSSQQQQHQSPTEDPTQAEQWPLKPTPPPKPIPQTNRPPTSSGTGNYSTMPKVAAPPTLAPSPKLESGSPASSRAHTPVGQQNLSPQHTQGTIGIPSRLQQQPLTNEQEEKVQKKGCCCIVM